MKISQFVTSAIGVFYGMTTENLVAITLFGVVAAISLHRLMEELEENR